jgi:hypothetical protein
METADDQRPQPQLEMPQHDKASTFAAAEEMATTTTTTKQLSDESDAGEPEENYRGWKSMPYVIGEAHHSYMLLYITACLRGNQQAACMSITRSLSIEQSFIH